MSTSLLPASTSRPLAVVVPPIAEKLVEVLLSERVPKDASVYQLRRSISCGKAQPLHMLLTVLFEEADALEIPIAQVTDVLDLAKSLVEERRRLKLEAVGANAAHAIAGPSLLGDIKREDRYENEENYAELDVLANEDDPDAIKRLLEKSAAELHEQLRRDRRLTDHLARVLLREALSA